MTSFFGLSNEEWSRRGVLETADERSADDSAQRQRGVTAES
jgi:hypothetical protein